VIVNEHHRTLSAALAGISTDARVTAQSALYPHVALRRWAFLFPTEAEADVIALDVTSTTYPWPMNKYHPAVDQITNSRDFRVISARDGIILAVSKERAEFATGISPQQGSGFSAGLKSPEFVSFAAATGAPQARRTIVFEGGLVLDGYTVNRSMAVTTGELPYQITTYWHTTSSQMEAYRPVLFLKREDGALAWAYDEGTPTDIWFPTDQWPTGEQINISFPPLDLSSFSGVLIGVLTPSGNTWVASDRLQVVGDEQAEPLDQGTLGMLFDLSRF
jgi:hypothetical protein